MSVQAKNRPKRTPLGARNRLSFPISDEDRDKYHYRVLNDQDDRLARAQEAGYEFVQSDQKLGDPRAVEAGMLGANVAKPVGQGTVGYLMRIPKEYYEEDQQAKEDKLKGLEKSMKPNKAESQYGEGLLNT